MTAKIEKVSETAIQYSTEEAACAFEWLREVALGDNAKARHAAIMLLEVGKLNDEKAEWQAWYPLQKEKRDEMELRATTVESRLSAAVEENARLKDDAARRDETAKRYEQLDAGLYPQEKRRLDWLIQALESPPWDNFWYSGTPDYLAKARVIIDSALAGEG